MQLTLKCRDVSGSVSFPTESIDGLPAPERHYQINDHTVILNGPDFIVHHDVSELLSMADGLYRMLTPSEQDELSLAAQQAAMTQESAPVVDLAASQPAQEVGSENTHADTAPPAPSVQKKSSGG